MSIFKTWKRSSEKQARYKTRIVGTILPVLGFLQLMTPLPVWLKIFSIFVSIVLGGILWILSFINV